MPLDIVFKSLIAGLIASVACGFGALPLLIPQIELRKHTGIGYAFAGGLMFAASVYNLILPGLTMETGHVTLQQVLPVLAGLIGGSLFLAIVDRYIPHDLTDHPNLKAWGGRAGVLIFLAMCVHSIPEGVAVGVGYASGEAHNTDLGTVLAVAISIHNIPEGLAVAIPMRAAGASMPKCFLAAFLTSLPQPIAAVPAAVLAWFFKPIMTLLMGFAAGAMIFLILLELIPNALETTRATRLAWAFMVGFCLMLLVQVIL